MRKLYRFLLMLSLVVIGMTEGFSQCAPKGITTNPSAPINTEKPSKTNNFNWLTERYFINSSDIPTPQIESPFFQDDNNAVSNFIENPDRLPEDGWELIKYDFGYDEQGNP